MARKRLPDKRCPVQGKRMFRHYQDAARLLRFGHKRAGTAAAQPQSMYRCRFCKHWHLTHYTPAESREFRARDKHMEKKG